MFDVAVIGAGVAGLTVAQQLQQCGYAVVVVDKSRGVGGRAATRRLHGTRADHGLRYLEPVGEMSQHLVKVLCDRNILQLWTHKVDSCQSKIQNPKSKIPRYVASEGMNAIAKFLATGLQIQLNQRVQAITATDDKIWHLGFEAAENITAKAVVVAIPAPQAFMLLEPLAESILPAEFVDKLRSVLFDPCLAVIAGYPGRGELNLEWNSTVFSDNSDLAWIGLDSSKRPNAEFPVFVMHSSAEFAKNYIDAEDLNPVAQHLLATAATELNLSWFAVPEWFQIHRWRYAFPSHPLQSAFLDAQTSLPLICCGDWCGGNLVESALNSGLAAAEQINRQLRNLSLPGASFFDTL
ncbi:NAD(P)/FAD-dependent oxidoreductase [Argonema galeatum]|uniref:NAD(P)/FAD-dependent oxidoreductase n=1 Tax=Argonema galeatum TaxID=2942762 RepID=UPI002011A695|nr:FAD-dependent oxidoreductase [Argonema galeatum A003/A1]